MDEKESVDRLYQVLMRLNKENLLHKLLAIISPNEELPYLHHSKIYDYHYLLDKLLETFSIELEQMEISKRIFHSDIKKILKEFKREEKEDLNDLILKIQCLKEKYRNKEFNSFDLAFPINIHPAPNIPDSIPTLGYSIEPISYDNWLEGYLNPTIENNQYFKKFWFKRTPNRSGDKNFAHMKVLVNAKDSEYAIWKAFRAANLLVSKINFVRYRNCYKPRPGSNTLSRSRWSKLMKPYIFLFRGDEMKTFFSPQDYTKRFRELIHWERDKFSEQLSELPELDLVGSDVAAEKRLINALHCYQEGITEYDQRKSFFDFWRGIEALTQTQNYSKILDRAYACSEFGNTDYAEEIIDSLDELRHDWAHANQRYPIVGTIDQEFTKIFWMD